MDIVLTKSAKEVIVEQLIDHRGIRIYLVGRG